VQSREEKDGGAHPANIYTPFHAAMQWDGKYESKVASWRGIGNVIPIEGNR
jgi:hypothetical protein